MTKVCGTGGWAGPLPGDPDNNVFLSASPAFGGIDVSWTYPGSNPHAVAHTLLYRATSPNFATAIQRSVVAGNFFYDKLNVGNTYFYWIRIISVNGTPGELIGPASAQARPLIADLIEILTGQIQDGLLAQTLRTHLDQITVNYGELQAEILNRINSDNVLSLAVSDVADQAQQTLAFVAQEITTRANGDTALAQQIDALGVLNNNVAALVTTETQARITEDGALALRVESLEVAGDGGAAAVLDIQLAKIGYSAINDGTGNAIPYDGNNVTIVYPAIDFPAVDFPHYAVDRKRIIDKEGVDLWNATPAGVAKPLLWVVGLPLATAIKRVGVTGPNGEYASLETAMTAQKDLNGVFKGMYTAKVDVNGLIGGFAVLNDGVDVEAGFDVNRFWIGKQQPAGQPQPKRFPFMVIGNEVFMDQAIIYSLTFTKLRDEAGGFMVENGKLKTQYIDTRGMQIKDIYGNVVFSAGTGMDWTRLVNKPPLAPSDATKSRVFSQPTMPDPAISTVNDVWVHTGSGNAIHYFDGDWWYLSADRTALSIAAGIAGQGALATTDNVFIGNNVRLPDGSVMSTSDFVNRLSKITQGNIGTFMDTAAIGTAYIGNLAVKHAQIGYLEVLESNIGTGAVSKAWYGQSAGAEVAIGISIPGTPSERAMSVVIIADGGKVETQAISESSGGQIGPARTDIYIDGVGVVASGYGTVIWIGPDPYPNYYTVRAQRFQDYAGSFVGPVKLQMLLTKK